MHGLSQRPISNFKSKKEEAWNSSSYSQTHQNSSLCLKISQICWQIWRNFSGSLARNATGDLPPFRVVSCQNMPKISAKLCQNREFFVSLAYNTPGTLSHFCAVCCQNTIVPIFRHQTLLSNSDSLPSPCLASFAHLAVSL